MNNDDLNSAVASFLAWERASQDTIDFKRIYADLAGDVLAGLVLSQIIYWHLPDKYGQTKLRVNRDGELWVAKARSEWWDEIRIGPRQFDRAIHILEGLGLVASSLHRFNGKPTIHVRLLWNIVLPKLNHLALHPVKNPYLIDEALVDNGFVINNQTVTDSSPIDYESVKSLTETTSETTKNTLRDTSNDDRVAALEAELEEDVEQAGEAAKQRQAKASAKRLSSQQGATSKQNTPRQPTPRGDLFVAIRDSLYFADTGKATAKRAGADTKLLLADYPDATAQDVKNFTRDWRLTTHGLAFPRGDKFVIHFGEWRRNKKLDVIYETLEDEPVHIETSTRR